VATPSVADTVNRYVELLGMGSADELTALYTSDATVEDPVGTGVRRGHDEIRDLYRGVESRTAQSNCCRCTSTAMRLRSWRG
jgi:steroid Delta-isomerase